MRFELVVALLTLTALRAYPGERWQLQYFHDADDRSLVLNDLRFVTPERGMAVGAFVDLDSGKEKPAALVTNDGGRTWTEIGAPDIGMSVFFDAGLGWMAGSKGIWRTTSFGREWKKMKDAHDMAAIAFADREHGWAAGARGAAFETSDGGERWRQVRLPGTDQLDGAPNFTSAAFADGKFGVIAGTFGLPEVIESTTPLVLATFDGGRTWTSGLSGRGRILQVRLSPAKTGVAALEVAVARPERQAWGVSCWLAGIAPPPAEPPKIPAPPSNIIVTDLHLAAGGAVYVTGYEPSGSLAHADIPGKLHVFRMTDGKLWSEIPVDYRVAARRAVLAAAGNDLWLATDTGMILKLVED